MSACSATRLPAFPVGDFQFGHEQEVENAKRLVFMVDDQRSAAGRLGKKLSVRHMKRPTVGQVYRKGLEWIGLMDGA